MTVAVVRGRDISGGGCDVTTTVVVCGGGGGGAVKLGNISTASRTAGDSSAAARASGSGTFASRMAVGGRELRSCVTTILQVSSSCKQKIITSSDDVSS